MGVDGNDMVKRIGNTQQQQQQTQLTSILLAQNNEHFNVSNDSAKSDFISEFQQENSLFESTTIVGMHVEFDSCGKHLVEEILENSLDTTEFRSDNIDNDKSIESSMDSFDTL